MQWLICARLEPNKLVWQTLLLILEGGLRLQQVTDFIGLSG
jgi:hypothetical protein